MHAAKMSVPPLLPLFRNTMPSPIPSIAAPMTHAIKDWSPNTFGNSPSTIITFCAAPIKTVITPTAKIVLSKNLTPNNFSATHKRQMLIIKYVYCGEKDIA